MNLLLDTHVLLWWMERSRRLGPKARQTLSGSGVRRWLSSASVWEISIKTARGRLELADPMETTLAYLFERGLQPLPVSIRHALTVASLPHHHTDPFDRMLVAQAQCEGLTIVTADPAIGAYDVRTLDASL
jgi:PIN domain nuclease of toxin-antitoxin system